MLQDDTLIELVYRPEERTTFLGTYSAGRWTLGRCVDLAGQRLVPFSPRNNLIKNGVVLLPSELRIYESEQSLIFEIAGVIHRYADLTPILEQVACHYLLLSWLHDAFNELPYLRLRMDFGTGKARSLLTIGSLCYKPFFASGASTVSPIFHTLDAFLGRQYLTRRLFALAMNDRRSSRFSTMAICVAFRCDAQQCEWSRQLAVPMNVIAQSNSVVRNVLDHSPLAWVDRAPRSLWAELITRARTVISDRTRAFVGRHFVFDAMDMNSRMLRPDTS